MADKSEQYPKAHYYLLAKGHYSHTESWLIEFKKITCFYLDKVTVTDEEMFNHLIPEVFSCIVINENMEGEFMYFFTVIANYLNQLDFNPDIAREGWHEALAQGCATILMRVILGPDINLEEPDLRILPFFTEQGK